MLIKDLFDPLKPLNEPLKEKYIFLLAYASSAQEITTEQGTNTDLTEVNNVREALTTVVPVCKRGPFSHDLQSSVKTFMSSCSFVLLVFLSFKMFSYPVISMGIQYWIEKCLIHPDFQAIAPSSSFPPTYLELILHVLFLSELEFNTQDCKIALFTVAVRAQIGGSLLRNRITRT